MNNYFKTHKHSSLQADFSTQLERQYSSGVSSQSLRSLYFETGQISLPDSLPPDWINTEVGISVFKSGQKRSNDEAEEYAEKYGGSALEYRLNARHEYRLRLNKMCPVD